MELLSPEEILAGLKDTQVSAVSLVVLVAVLKQLPNATIILSPDELMAASADFPKFQMRTLETGAVLAKIEGFDD